jgi:serine/threonine-protein kinase RsbW
LSEPEASVSTSPERAERRRPRTSSPAQKSLGTVELRIPSKAEWVAVARLTVAAIANRLPFSVEDIEDLKLAIAEACTYVIQAGRPSDTIDITCETGADHLTIRVHDGGAIHPESAPRRPSGGSIEGLGIFLIQALMDDVQHTADGESGGELIMTKRVGS